MTELNKTESPEKSPEIESESSNKHSPKYTEICLAGACNRGISYIGVLKRLEELDLIDLKSLTRVVGVSIGSMIAACILLGYTTDELFDEIINKNISDLKDFTINEPSAILKGNEYKKWVHEIVTRKESADITLLELYNKTNIHFIITTTCIQSNSELYPEGYIQLDHNNSPDMPLITAVLSSMAFPFIFPPVEYQGHLFIDGGVLDNFPMKLLDINAIGIRVNFKQIEDSTKNPILYIGKIFELLTVRYRELKNEQHKNIIIVDCSDYSMIDFDMSIDDKITLYMRGYESVNESPMTQD